MLFDYFAAPTDGVASSTLASGPRPAAEAGAAVTEVIEDAGLNPTVELGTLEELLGGRSFEEQLADSPAPVAMAEETWVMPVQTELVELLAAASDDELTAVLDPWLQTEELVGADPEDAQRLLTRLAALARHASRQGLRVYCWMSL